MKAFLVALWLSHFMYAYADDSIPNDLNFREKHTSAKGNISGPVFTAPMINAPNIIKDDSGNEAITRVDNLSLYAIMPVSAFFLVCVIVGNVIGLKGPTKAIPVSASTTMVVVILGFFVRYAIEGGHWLGNMGWHPVTLEVKLGFWCSHLGV